MKPIKFFICSAGGILLAAALERFLVAAGSHPALALPEPLIGIRLRLAVLLIGGLELTVAWICLFGKNINLQLGWLGWLATNYAVYRIGLFTMHDHQQATGIGSLTDPLHLARGTTGIIISLLPLYLLLGCYAAVFWLWLGKDWVARSVAAKPGKTIVASPVPMRNRLETFVRTLKISCTACGGHIEFPTNFFGERIPCPHCKTSIILQKARNLKMSCTACAGHLEFPDHALGQTIPCPHCNQSITLKEPS